MMKLLILYPSLFNARGKFTRKLSKILANKEVAEVSYLSNENNLIEEYFTNLSSKTILNTVSQIDWQELTHAVVFDDGEEFVDELAMLSEKNIPHRVIKIKITRVVNINLDTQYKGLKSNKSYEYIGRGSYWGNPYSMFEDGDDRQEVIRKFKYDFDYEKFPHIEKKEVYKLAGKRLGCFCKPDACHGDVLAEHLNSWDDGK